MSTFVIKINGVDVSSYVHTPSLKIEFPVSRKGATASFDYLDTTLTKNIASLSTVDITDVDGVTPLFTGVIVKPEYKPTSATLTTITCPCVDISFFLNSVLVNEEYTNLTADTIIKNLFTKYLPGVTTTHVQSGPIIAHVLLAFSTLDQALKKIATLAGVASPIIWFVDASKDLHWGTITQLGNAPVNFSDKTTDITAGYIPYERSSFVYASDGTQLVNQVKFRGGSALSNNITDSFVADGQQKSFVLTYPPSQQSGAIAPTITVNGASKTIAFETSGAATTQWVIAKSKTLNDATVKTGTAATPANGDIIAVTYQYDVPIIITVNDGVSQAQFSTGLSAGIFQKHLRDDSIRTFQAAVALANTYMLEHAYPIPAVKLKLLENYVGSGLLPGQICTVVNSQLNVSVQMVILHMVVQGTSDGLRTIQLDLEGV